MKRRGFIKKALLTGAAVCGASQFAKPAIAKGMTEWQMTTTWPKNFPGLGTAANMLSEMIGKASDGRLTIKVYGAGEIVPAFEAMDAVMKGTVQMGHGAPYYWKGKQAAAQFLAGTPFGLTAQEQNAWLDFADGQKIADKLYQDFNCKFFACGNTGVQMGGWYNREMNSIADYQGLKLRMPGLGGEVVKSFGATVVNLPGGSLLSSMQSGAIDAMEWVGPYNDLAFGMHKVAKHYYFPGWHEPATILDGFINLDAWNALPTDLQEIVTQSCRAVNQYVTNEFTARNAAALLKLQDQHNVTAKAFAPEMLSALKARSHEVLSALANADPESQKIYQSLTDFQKQNSRWTEISEQAYLNARQA